MFIEARLVKKGLPTDTAEYYRGAATDDEIDFAVHYQNKKLIFYYEHSKIKKWIDASREKRQLRKAMAKAIKEAEKSTAADVTGQTSEEFSEQETASVQNEQDTQE